MNEQQRKAAASLKRALKKCGEAGLAVDAFTDVGLYVSPVDLHDDPERYRDPHTWYEENGINCDPHNLQWDGGAGV